MLILAFEANSSLSCQNGLFAVFYVILRPTCSMLNFIKVGFCLICRFHSFDNGESCSQVVFSKGHTARNGRQTKRSVDTNFEICTVFYDRNQGLNQKTMTFIGSEYALSPKNPSSSIASIPEIFVFLWFKNYKGIYIFIRFATFN